MAAAAAAARAEIRSGSIHFNLRTLIPYRHNIAVRASRRRFRDKYRLENGGGCRFGC